MKSKFFPLAILFSIALKASIEFPPSPSYSISQEKNHYSIKIGDINGDGLVDLIFSGYGEKVEVYFNSYSGISSTPSYTSNENQSCYELALGDLDRNGYLDIIVANFEDPLRVYFNFNGVIQGSPGYEAQDSLNLTSLSIFNSSKDGWLDVVTAGFYVPIKVYKNENGILPGNASWQSNEEDLAVVAIKTADIDKDGFSDIVLASEGGPLRVYKNSEGNFSTVNWESPIYLDAKNLALSDINSDGYLDAIVAQWNNSYVAFKNINGNFEDYPSYYSFLSGFYEGIDSADLDGDGYSEVFVSNDSFKVEGYDNLGGEISTLPDYETNESAHNWGIGLGDLNSDGKIDYCVARRFQRSSCFYNLGNFNESNPSSGVLYVDTVGQNVTFYINDPSDDNTPQIALSYFLRIGTASNSNDVLYSPNSETDFTPINGDFHTQTISLNLPDGNYYASAKSVDLALRRSIWSNEVNFIIDITAPYSSFTYPSNNGNIITCGTINVQGVAFDNVSGIKKVEFSYDGTNYFLAEGKENWNYLWNVVSSGNYTLYSKAEDNKGNIEAPPNSINLQITIDEIPPENVGNSLFAYKIAQNEVNLSWQDKSPSGATGYNIYKGFTPNFMQNSPSPYDTSTTNSYNDNSGVEDLIFYKVKAFDICGNESGD